METNKVIFGGRVLIDLTEDTVTPESLLAGKTAHDKSGASIEGTCSYDVDSGDADVLEAEIIFGKTAYARGKKITGSMRDNGAVSGTIESLEEDYIIPHGFHDGSGKVSVNSDDKAKLIPANIKQGVEILGVVGTCEPSSEITVQPKTATPGKDAQTILPDEGFDYLSQVTVEAIPVSETPNLAGGMTVTIAG